MVLIRTKTGIGSGFLINGSGLVVTNKHVVKDSFNVGVQLYDKIQYSGNILKSNSEYDIALIQILNMKGKSKGLPLCMKDSVKVGEEVIAIGSALTLSNSVTKGIVSSIRNNDNRNLIQTDVAVNSGNSGGPLLNKYGTVIGVITEKIVGRGIEGISFAIPIGEALRSLQVSVDIPSNTQTNECGNLVEQLSKNLKN
jgi:serine protease Do